MAQSGGGSSGNNGSGKQDPFNLMDMWRSLSSMRMPLMDRDTMMHQHRKNLEALTECNSMCADVMKSIGQLQTQFVKQAFDEMASYMQEFTKNLGKGNFEQNTNIVKGQVNSFVEHSNKIANMLSQSNKQIYDVFQSRIQEGMDELKNATNKQKKN